jgi:hypothetical protein
MERSPLRPRPTVTWGAVTCGAVTCGAVTCTGPAGQSRRCQALHGHGPQRRDGLHSIRALLDRDLDLATVLQAQLQVTDVHLRQLQRRAAVLRLALDDPSDAMILRLPTLSRLEAQERDDVFGGFWDRVFDGAPGDPALHARFRAVTVPELPPTQARRS